MSITLKVGLDFEWHITDKGNLAVDLVTSGGAKSLGQFVFDPEMLVESLEEDIDDKYINPEASDISEWTLLVSQLRSTANRIESAIEDAFQ